MNHMSETVDNTCSRCRDEDQVARTHPSESTVHRGGDVRLSLPLVGWCASVVGALGYLVASLVDEVMDWGMAGQPAVHVAVVALVGCGGALMGRALATDWRLVARQRDGEREPRRGP